MHQTTLKSLKFLHAALVITLSILAIIGYLFIQSVPEDKSILQTNLTNLQFLLPLVLMGFALFGYFSNKQKMDNARKEQMEDDKLSKYKSAVILHFGITEFAALICLLAYVASKEFNYYAYFLFCLAYLVYMRPSEFKMNRDLQTEKEKQG